MMTAISPPTRRLLALSRLKGVGPATLKKVATLPGFWELAIDVLSAASPQIARAVEGQSVDLAWDEAQRWAAQQEDVAARNECRILSSFDANYPSLLTETRDDPVILFVKGELANQSRDSVAIIGTREPTHHGVLIAQRITQFFVEQRWSVVSGLALGCDGVAHQAALDARGHTVAVLAHGLQMISPATHKALAHDILDAGGALVTEFAFGESASGPRFVQRDKTQAGLARGVVMIQSDLKGGSLHASRASLAYRRWLAVPYPTDKDRERGEPKVQANLLIADGEAPQRADLLRCTVGALDLVKVVRGRDDYLQLTSIKAPLGNEPSHFDLAARQQSPRQEATLPANGAQGHRSLQPMGSTDESRATSNLRRAAGQAEEESRAAVPMGCCLDVWIDDLKSVAVATIGGTTRAMPSDRVAILASRLDRLQSKLDRVKRLEGLAEPGDYERVLVVRFELEELLLQMTLAAQAAISLSRSVVERRQVDVYDPEATTASTEAEDLQAPGRLRPLVSMLEQLVRGLPDSIQVHSDPNTLASSIVDSSARIRITDIVRCLNELVHVARAHCDAQLPPNARPFD